MAKGLRRDGEEPLKPGREYSFKNDKMVSKKVELPERSERQKKNMKRAIRNKKLFGKKSLSPDPKDVY